MRGQKRGEIIVTRAMDLLLKEIIFNRCMGNTAAINIEPTTNYRALHAHL